MITKNITRVIFLLLIILHSSTSLFAQQSSLPGRYKISDSVNLFGKPSYTGTVNITNKRGIYRLIWNIPQSPRYEGVGIVVDNILCVGWSESGSYGVVVYKVEGGKLKGEWTTSKSDGIGKEDLEGPKGLSGVYEIVSSVSPETSRGYNGRVTINQYGDIYLVTWLLESESYSGVGILEGDLLIVGWGVGQKTGVVYYKIENNTLLGRWTIPQATKIGIENLSK